MCPMSTPKVATRESFGCSVEYRAMALVIVVLLGVTSILGGLVWSLTTDFSSHISVIAQDVNTLRLKLNAHIENHTGAPDGKAAVP